LFPRYIYIQLHHQFATTAKFYTSAKLMTQCNKLLFNDPMTKKHILLIY